LKSRPIPEIEGAYLISLQENSDSRGVLIELFNNQIIKGIQGWEEFFPTQINWVSSLKGSIRGIHRSKRQFPQMKIVFCTKGEIVDHLVDLRLDSKTYRNQIEILLSGSEKSCLLIPHRVGHGFQTISNDSEVVYLMKRVYSPLEELTINPEDPALGINWVKPHILSTKDKTAPFLESIELSLF
jgi:dTDP-4-dehydrorhamnose 3,5-epimerase